MAQKLMGPGWVLRTVVVGAPPYSGYDRAGGSLRCWGARSPGRRAQHGSLWRVRRSAPATSSCTPRSCSCSLSCLRRSTRSWMSWSR